MVVGVRRGRRVAEALAHGALRVVSRGKRSIAFEQDALRSFDGRELRFRRSRVDVRDRRARAVVRSELGEHLGLAQAAAMTIIAVTPAARPVVMGDILARRNGRPIVAR